MHEWKKTYIEFLVASNRTLGNITYELKPLQQSVFLLWQAGSGVGDIGN